MPAYHLKRADGSGITMVNIGVGPSNAKTITDHVAVLRPHAWIMLGHCAGLRNTQRLGDYVLAHDSAIPDRCPITSVVPYTPAMEAALAWYRARGVYHAPVGPTKVPTLYIWGDADDTVGRAAAEGTGAFIAAPYQFVVIPGGGHYTAEQAPDQVSALLLAHLARHPI